MPDFQRHPALAFIAPVALLPQFLRQDIFCYIAKNHCPAQNPIFCICQGAGGPASKLPGNKFLLFFTS
jgi:hypothetical protein